MPTRLLLYADALVEACRRACCCMPTRLLLHADAHAAVCRRARCCMLTRFLLCAFLVSTYLVGADSGSCLHTCMGLLSQLRLCILISMPGQKKGSGGSSRSASRSSGRSSISSSSSRVKRPSTSHRFPQHNFANHHRTHGQYWRSRLQRARRQTFCFARQLCWRSDADNRLRAEQRFLVSCLPSGAHRRCRLRPRGQSDQLEIWQISNIAGERNITQHQTEASLWKDLGARLGCSRFERAAHPQGASSHGQLLEEI